MKKTVVFWAFTFVLFTTFVFGAELERYSGQSEDDGQEATSGAVNTSYTYVELVVNLGRWGGAYRFPDITIPQGATINSAYISLQCFAGDWIHPVITIACEDVDSAGTLAGGSGNEYNISDRWSNRTDATVLWQEDTNGFGRDSTHNLSSLVHEIVNRPNWKSGNAIFFLFKCEVIGGDRSGYESYSWDKKPDPWEDPGNYYGAILYVDYTPGSAPNNPPIVSDIRDSTIAEGESFDPINLDDYVTDLDDHDSVIIWTHWSEVELLVDITERMVTITVPDSEWNGSETIWFKACDPGGLCDSNEATFTVTAVNDTPMVSDIPDQTISEGESFASINLDDYVDDPDNADDEMTWTYWGNVDLLVDITDRVATITVPDPEWTGSETIWFKARDPGGLCDSNEATFTVTAVNDTPMVSDIPDQTVAENDSFASINLDDYVEDPDNQDGNMIWTHWGNVDLLVDITDRVATITVPDPEWTGFETIWFKACDPGDLCDSNEATFTVVAFNDTPMVSDIPDQTIAENDSFASINLDDYVEDPDNQDGNMIWTHWSEVELLVDITDRVATIAVPDSEWNGSETIWFKACDPDDLCDSNEATFTVLGSNFTDEDSLLLRSADFLLNQNHPNPFNVATCIEFDLSLGCQVKLEIYNILGNKVKTLIDDKLGAGRKSITWDGKDDQGREVASGIYFYRLKAGEFTESKKMVIIK